MAISAYLRELRRKVGRDLVLMPGVAAVIVNDDGHVLLQRSSETGRWTTIGGAMDPGEQPADAAVREAMEEAGVVVSPERIVAVDTMPPQRYNNGDLVQYVITVFLCRHVDGEPRINDDESIEIRFFPPDALPPMADHEQLWVAQAIWNHPTAWFRQPESILEHAPVAGTD